MNSKEVYERANNLFAEIKLLKPNFNFYDYLADGAAYSNIFKKVLLRRINNQWNSFNREDLDRISDKFDEIAALKKEELFFPKNIYDCIVAPNCNYADKEIKYLSEDGVEDICRYIALLI